VGSCKGQHGHYGRTLGVEPAGGSRRLLTESTAGVAVRSRPDFADPRTLVLVLLS
jgi:hypothetical protein